MADLTTSWELVSEPGEPPIISILSSLASP